MHPQYSGAQVKHQTQELLNSELAKPVVNTSKLTYEIGKEPALGMVAKEQALYWK